MIVNQQKSKSFIRYLDQQKTKSLNYVDYYSIFHNTMVDYYSNMYHETTYSGYHPFYVRMPLYANYPSANMRKIDVTNLFRGGGDCSGETVLQSPTPVILQVDKIESISDLIELIDKNPYKAGYTYNIDLKSLSAVRCELDSLNNMIGMKTLKNAIIDQVLYFLQNLHVNGGESDFKHTALFGPPGTGKTEVAKLIGQMYSKMGVLKNNVFKKVTRADLVAGYLGQTALKTKAVIDSCIGGVLFIDEAYSLSNAGNDLDNFSKECIDTLCEALSDHKHDLMVIIAGYEDELKRDFFGANRGLESRFVWRYTIDSYNARELREIFLKKVCEGGWEVSDGVDAKWFEKEKDKFKYFGRDMETLLFYVKIAHSRRVFGLDDEFKKKITAEDMKNGMVMFTKNKVKEEDTVRKYLLSGMYT
jgi:SpoVK/Ycf46/Vps4 family AAA+-type ATPase